MDRTSRRQFLHGGLALAGLGLLAGCQALPSPKPSPARVWRIGILGNFPSRQWDAFRDGLRELGYVEGQNLALEERWSEGFRDRFPALAAELIPLDVDAIVASGNPAARAAREATGTIPIVSPNMSVPVDTGLVASLAHPSGNLTGLALLVTELEPKRLELLTGAVPAATGVAYLAETPRLVTYPELHGAAQALGVQLQGHLVQDSDGLDAALQRLAGGQADALLVGSSPLYQLHRTRILDAAAKASLPAMYPYEEYVREGGLLFYGPNQPDLFRRAATHVDKILKGAKPADLPVELPTKFDFIINLKTAQALGLTIPEVVLAQATEVLQ